jgi:hypothetical protein
LDRIRERGKFRIGYRADAPTFAWASTESLPRVFRDGDQAPMYPEWVGSNGVKPSPMSIAMYRIQGLSE